MNAEEAEAATVAGEFDGSIQAAFFLFSLAFLASLALN
jgi:hypothetical protein